MIFQTNAIVRQLRNAEGLVGFGLRAKPIRGEYWTLSAWKSADEMNTFVRGEPHKTIMKDLRPLLKQAKFVRWELSGSQLPPRWPDSLERLATD